MVAYGKTYSTIFIFSSIVNCNEYSYSVIKLTKGVCGETAREIKKIYNPQ